MIKSSNILTMEYDGSRVRDIGPLFEYSPAQVLRKRGKNQSLTCCQHRYRVEKKWLLTTVDRRPRRRPSRPVPVSRDEATATPNTKEHEKTINYEDVFWGPPFRRSGSSRRLKRRPTGTVPLKYSFCQNSGFCY